jgi:opacity protein-like surface antigen
MKKSILFLFVTLVINTIFAQDSHRNTVAFQAGASLFGTGRFADVKPNENISFTGGNVRVLPTLQGTFDYDINNWLSIGVAASYNNAKIKFEDIKYQNKAVGNASVKIARTSLAARLLFHYGKNDRFDMYSGLRGGVGLWSGAVTASIDDEVLTELLNSVDGVSIPNFIEKRLTKGSTARAGFAFPQVQVIPFGMRYYITENIGLNAEVALGAPYYFAAGANVKF